MPKVLYDKRGEIAYITLNRPDKRNAIDTETDDLLFDAWTRFREDDGAGLGRSLLGRGFAGDITRGLHRTKKPIIAALDGTEA